MLILGIETATHRVGCAIGGHEGVIALYESARDRRHAETLVPAIQFVTRQARIGSAIFFKDCEPISSRGLPTLPRTCR